MIYLRYRVHDFGDDSNELGHKLRKLPASRLMEWSVSSGIGNGGRVTRCK